MVRKATGWVSAVALLCIALLGMLWVAGDPVPAAAAPEYAALRGADRYDTAIRISQAGFSPGVAAVVLATGEDFPDALTAAPLAGAHGGPVLLTHSAALDEATRTELVRLRPSRVFVVGLGDEVAGQVRAALPELGSDGVVLILGVNRYDTARLVAMEVKARLGEVSGVIIAPGDIFPDALAAAPLAAAKGWPIVLTPAAGPVPEATKEALVELEASTAVEVGSYADPGVLGLALTRLVGKDRYDTGRLIAEYAVGQGLSFEHVALATGQNFPDALAAGPYLALDSGILLLTQNNAIPPATLAELRARLQEVQRVDFVGLSGAITGTIKVLLSMDDLPPAFGSETLRQGSQGAAVAWLEQRLTDLSYRPGPVDGVFDKRTHQAVIAFQKWEGLQRDGVVGPAVWTRLAVAARPAPQKSDTGTWVEVDKTRQVLLFVQDGAVLRTLPVSTGNPNVGIITPSRTFTVYRTAPVWEGPRYKPCYLRNLLAIHGYPSVPPYPASHGCIRVTLWDQDELYPLMFVGMRVHVY